MKDRPTIKDVARVAGVGTSTVTRVVHAQGYVAEKTRAAVVAAMEQTGYQVNSLARSLKQRRSFVIGHLLRSTIPNPFYLMVARGVEDEAKTRGYTALTYNVQGAAEAERRGIDTFLNWRADALIFTTPVVAENVDFAFARGVPVVQVERPKSTRAPGITVDNYAGASAAMQHLIALGHRNIAYVGGLPAAELAGYVEMERIGAYRDAMAAIGGTCEEYFLAGSRYLLDAENSLRPGYDSAVRLLSSARRPTAIQCANDIVAAGVLQAIREAGLSVPEDISVIGFDDTLGHYLAPQLTTVRLPAYELGQTAARMVIDAVEGRKPETPSVPQISAAFVQRRSTAAPPA